MPKGSLLSLIPYSCIFIKEMKSLSFSLLLLVILIASLFSCASSVREVNRTEEKSSIRIKRVALMPFSSRLEGIGQKEGFLTDALYGELTTKSKGIAIIPPEPSKEEFMRVKEGNPNLSDRDIALRAGKNLGADAVLIGSISEYREREGGELGITSPASVAFGVQLIDTSNGKTLWESYFAETQRFLLENIFELNKFIRRKGKWITADELAREGTVEVADRLNDFLVKYSTAK